MAHDKLPSCEFCPNGRIIGDIGGDKLLHSLATLGEVLFKPIKYFRHHDPLATDFIARGIAQEKLGLPLQLLFQFFGRVGLIEQGRAADGGAVDGKMGSGFGKLLAQNTVFNFIQMALLAQQAKKPLLPRAANKAAQVLDRPDRIIVDDQLDREGIVGIDPKGVLLGFCPGFKLLLCHRRQLFQVGVKLRGIAL